MLNTVHITSPIVGSGNRIDLELVAPLLTESGFKVTQYGIGNRGRLTRSGQLAKTMIRSPLGFRLNIFMGPIFPEWFPVSAKAAWIPNPEGVSEATRQHLPRIDMVLAKTRLTERIFKKLGRPVEYIGFTSRDRFLPDVKRDHTRFFHACSSPYKGSMRLVENWRAHPEWPELVVVISNEDKIVASMKAPNVRVIEGYIPESEFRELQNTIGCHVCCSEAEGFGHYIYEALSCGALVMTTDGPPMNEFAAFAPGFLLACEDFTPEIGLSNRYYFKPASLAEQVERVLSLDPAKRQELAAAGRAYFLENDRQFRKRFPEVVGSLMA